MRRKTILYIWHYVKLIAAATALAAVASCDLSMARTDDTISIVDSRVDDKKVVLIFHLGSCDIKHEIDRSDMNNERLLSRALDEAIRFAEGRGRCYTKR